MTITPDDLEPGKPRKRGTLPPLPDRDDLDGTVAWLTGAFRPPAGWRLHTFVRAGRDKNDPAALTFANGRNQQTFRFDHQRDLYMSLRLAVAAVTGGWCEMPHLTGSEVEDVWQALCRLGQVTAEHDALDEARKWMRRLIEVTLPLRGFSLVPDHRHDALMALRKAGEFVKSDALQMIRPGDSGDSGAYQQRPARLIDKHTAEQWVRAGEAVTFVRWVVGVEPLAASLFRARLGEIGVDGQLFEDHRPPHPKAQMYRLTDELVEYAESLQNQ